MTALLAVKLTAAVSSVSFYKWTFDYLPRTQKLQPGGAGMAQ